LGRSFNCLLDRLQESFERQRRFTGDASHQLRTPLTAMLGQVDLALRQERSVAEYQRVLALVQKKTRHLRQIVESLLFLSRADSEAQQPQLELIDVAGWLTEHIRSWHDSRRVSDLKLEVETDDPPWLRVQPSLLGELVNNLLDNASKYSAPGTSITVRLRREGQVVLLAVEDRGIGIAEGEIPHVFEPFYRSSEARHKDSAGLGLGLSVALRLARPFGGTIGVVSHPGRGSTFTIRFPPEAPPPPVNAPPITPSITEAGASAR
jgi:signal transduction histidine kinase